MEERNKLENHVQVSIRIRNVKLILSVPLILFDGFINPRNNWRPIMIQFPAQKLCFLLLFKLVIIYGKIFPYSAIFFVLRVEWRNTTLSFSTTMALNSIIDFYRHTNITLSDKTT